MKPIFQSGKKRILKSLPFLTRESKISRPSARLRVGSAAFDQAVRALFDQCVPHSDVALN